MKAEILKMLRESQDYVSGQQICERFQVSRTAVWKVIKQLKEEGYEVEAVRNRGYRLSSLPDILSREEIVSQIDTVWAGQNVYYFTETDSTNIQAKRMGDQGAPHGTLAAAGQQTAGKGRRGRTWESPADQNIYMSLLLRPEIAPVKAPMLTLVMAYAAAMALRECTGLDVQIKWPNDLVINGKKICGILTEMSTEIDYINYVVIGIGINTNIEQFPEELKQTATSLRIEAGRSIRRSPLIAAIMRWFEKAYAGFMKTEDLSGIQKAYNELLVNCGREVRVLEPKGEWQAEALGINDGGELLVRKVDGSETAVYAGEVSVRGIYGYV